MILPALYLLMCYSSPCDLDTACSPTHDHSMMRSHLLESSTIDSADITQSFLDYNLAKLWIGNQDAIIGFFGKHYQRFSIRFSSFRRDRQDRSVYQISGKTKVKSTICSFEGTMTVVCSHQLVLSDRILLAEEESQNIAVDTLPRGVTLLKYRFATAKDCKLGGSFEGYATTLWHIDADGFMQPGEPTSQEWDGYFNNAFVGVWKSFDNVTVETCNWGENRIPDCGDLDVGAGEFSPNRDYWDYGWDTYVEHWW
jgi:hypothetical protein